MGTQTGSISFEANGGFNSYVKQNYATLSQIKGQFAICGTGAATAEKVATIVPTNSGWTLYEGASVTVKFINKNEAVTPTLNINSTGAKPIKDYVGNALESTAYNWSEGVAISFTYDGTYWRLQDSNLMERIHTAETSIEQNATNIALKVNANDVYNKTGVDNLIAQEVTARNAAITTSADNITQSVSSTYATKTELNDEITARNTAITASADNITQSVSSTYATKTELNDEVTARNAAINTKANEITSTVASTYTTKTEFNNLEIGGRNLLQKSSNPVTGTSSAYFIEFTTSNEKLTNQYHLEANIKYTFSCDVSTTREPFKISVGAGNGAYSKDVASTGDTLTSGHVSITFTPTSTNLSSGDIFAFRAPRYGSQGTEFTYTISNWKLEKGDKATDWTPAPEDLEERVSSAESAIIQNANNIALKVSTTDYNGNTIASLINQSADSVKISANHVDIEGATIFSSGGAYDVSTTIVNTQTQWYSSTNSSSKTDGYWGTSQPAVTPGRYIWQRELVTYANGTTEYKPSEAGVCIQGQTDLSSVAPKTSAVFRTQQIYYRTNTALTNSITGPTTWIGESGNKYNTTAPTTAITGWSIKPTPLAASAAENVSKYLYLYTCTQTQTVAQAANNGTTCSASTVLLDDTETIIDGGKIITNSIDTNSINANSGTFNVANIPDLNANKITSGYLSADRIDVGSINVNKIDATSGTFNTANIPNLDAAKITSGTIDSARINTSTISISSFSDADDYATKDDLENIFDPIASKTYTDLIGTSANNAAECSFYFAKVHPKSYTDVWHVKLRLHVTEPITYVQQADIDIYGDNSNFRSYNALVARDTNLAIYYLNLYRATKAGIETNKKGHALGIGLRGSTNYADSTYARTVIVDILETDNCSVQMLDIPVKYANMDGTGSTNYAGLNELYIAGNGQQATNNANTYDRRLYNSNVKAAANLTAGRIVCGTSTGYKNIAIGTSFDIAYPLLYNNTTFSSGGQRADLDLERTNIVFTNNGSITGAQKYLVLYLMGIISGNTFTITDINKATSGNNPIMTCTIPNSENGLFYIPLGALRDSTTNGKFISSKDLYAYIDGKFRQVTPTEIVATHRIYYRTTNAISNLAAPTAWIDEATGNVYDTWTTKVPPLASGIDSSVSGYTKYPYLYTCEQRKRLDGTSQCTKVLLDENTTVIDGGKIITGSVQANAIKADSGTFNTANIPNLDAAKITSGSISADRIKGNVISAINNGAGTINADKINVSQINIGNLAGEIGGRNLLLQTATPATMASKAITAGSYVIYDIYTMRAQYSELNLTTNDSLTLSFDWTSSNVPSGTVTFKVGTAVSPWEYFGILATLPSGSGSGHVEKTYKVTSALAAAASDKLRVRIDSSAAVSANAMPIVFSNVKLEKGTKATDWTPAPEDVSSAISDASQIASNYIHADSTGINIYDSSLTDSNKYYLRQTAGGTYIYRNNYLKAKYEDTITLYGGSNASGANPKVELSSTQFKMTDSGGIQRLLLDSTNGAIVGKPAAGHAQITDTGMYVYDTNNKKRTDITASGLQVYNASGTSVGLFSDTARIGTVSGARTEVTSTGVELYNSSNQKKVSIGTGASYFYGGAGTYPYIEINNSDLDAINIKQSATSYSSITSEGLSIYTTVDDTAKQIAEFGANGATIGLESDTYMEITNNGMRIVDNEENVFASLCKDESQIGVLDATHLTLSDEGIIGYGPQLKPVFTIDLNCGTLNENFDPTIAHSWTWRIPGNALPSNFLFSGSTSYDIQNATLVSGTWKANDQSITIGATSTDRDKWSVTGTPTVSSGSNTLQIYLNNDLNLLKIIFKQSVTQTPGISNTDTHIISSLNLVYQYSTKVSFSSPIEIEVKRALSEDNRVSLSCKMRILNNGLRAPGGSNLICRFGGHFPEVTRTVQAPAFVLGDSISGHGKYSTTIGHSLYAPYDYQTVFGKYNNLANYAIVLGNGTDDSNRSCSFLVDWDGSISSGGHIHASSDILAYDKVSVRESSVTRNTNPTSSQWPNALEICDSRGTVIGYVRGQFINDNYEGVQLETIRTINNTNYYNGVRFEISNTGAYRTSFNQPASVRSGLGLGSLATKNNATVSWTVKEASVKDSTARSAGANFGINITTGSAGAGWVPISVVAITHSGWDPVMVSYDMDGLSANGSAVVKTYWHANGALSANSVTYSAQVVYIKDTAS